MAIALRFRSARSEADDQLIRSELFGVERLEQHGESLAMAQRAGAAPVRAQPLLARVEENAGVLARAYADITATVRRSRAITPAAEWLLDNSYVVDAQLRDIRADLPPGYYRKLPKLSTGHLAGYPRVYGVAWAFVAHTDSRFDPDSLRRFVRAYQRVQPLTIGELWAVAITLRVVLVENLRRLAVMIRRRSAAQARADTVADALLRAEAAKVAPATVLREFEDGPLPMSFAVELVHRFREEDPESNPALSWLHQRLRAQGTSASDIVRMEHQRQAEMTVTVRNIITSMRQISQFDWSVFVESVSVVDEYLRGRSNFGELDFASRDGYRHAVEELAERSRRGELDVAQAAMSFAARETVSAHETPDEARRRDPGFFLVGDGRAELEESIGASTGLGRWLRRMGSRGATPLYLGAIVVITAGVLAIPLVLTAPSASAAALVLLGVLGIIPASDLAIALVNRAAVALVPPRLLPRLELRDGVPPAWRTIVAMPVLFMRHTDPMELVGQLEVHYLANPEGDVRYALLSDWEDAAVEHLAGDDERLERARAGIAELNARYGALPDGSVRFLLFHRARRWNEREGVWMGWERKRGKLHELNRLLRGATDTSFVFPAGKPPIIPPDVRFVITLDSDTQIPIGSVAALVGTIAHPLHRPAYDAQRRRVTSGYGILQPRVTPLMPAGRSSLYQRTSASPAGIDPYAAAVSDVYQDLFGEGSYTGKGIYDIDAFETALAGRVPENALLSHDLLEGTFARAGLASNITVFERNLWTYRAATARQHRWARGDWQLLPWLFAHGIPFIARWKMLDNMRRALSPLATVLLLAAAWWISAASPANWALFVLATIAIPAMIPALDDLLRHARGRGLRARIRSLLREIASGVAHVALTVTMLGYQAWLMADAVLRTLWRVLVSHRHMLEWVTSAQTEARPRLSTSGLYRRMAGAVAVAAAGALIVRDRPDAWPTALPLIALWALSPAVARWISIPRARGAAASLSPEHAVALRTVARRTWSFFETFVDTGERALPPDNFQETPEPVVARRTSPTNIGLYLISTVAARDFGWIGAIEMLDRIEATLTSTDRLDRFRGHLYNWYDTAAAQPLAPRYVSFVDSGNYAGCLLAAGNAIAELTSAPLVGAAALHGIADAVRLAREDVERSARLVSRDDLEALLDALDEVAPGSMAVPTSPGDWRALLERVDAAAALAASRLTHALDVTGDDAIPEDTAAQLRLRVAALQACTASHLRDIDADSADVEARATALAARAHEMAAAMDFSFLFDAQRKLFSLGWRVDDASLDPGRYDLLASEARLASFIAIARGDVPMSHWFRLGRPLTPVGAEAALLSWSGSMFEYLMPSLLMRAPAGGLIARTNELAVRKQIEFGDEHGVPWGVSESGYNVQDRDATYQYSNFGVPALGLRRRLGDDLVIAPYATALASMIDPVAALENFERLDRLGAAGAYGFYEAADYTPTRVPEGDDVAIVRSFMAHHQGMVIAALANVVHNGRMRARFHAEPMVRASELLLQERTPPMLTPTTTRMEEEGPRRRVRANVPPAARRYLASHRWAPRTQLLSNGRYAVMVTTGGSGYSRHGALALTRWREDPTCDAGGGYIYLRDLQSGDSWSAAYHPRGGEPDDYTVSFTEDRAEIVRREGSITSKLDIIVSSEDDVEIRRVTLTNLGSRSRVIELTSYAEVVLAPPASDAAHPAFSNLFVTTEAIPERATLLATRRARAPGESPPWLAHVMALSGDVAGALEWETDRARFLGRGRTPCDPAVMLAGARLSGTVGPVLDPIVSLRRAIRLMPGQSALVTFATMIAPTREAALALAEKYDDVMSYERAATLAWSQARVERHHLGLSVDDAHLFQTLASSILYWDRTLRAPVEMIARQRGGRDALWSQGISGDFPIVALEIEDPADMSVVREALRAHEYWSVKQLTADLVILNDHGATYAQELQSQIETAVRLNQSKAHQGGPDTAKHVFILRVDQLTSEQRDAILAAARVSLSAHRGSLGEQVERAHRARAAPPRRLRKLPAPPAAAPFLESPELEFRSTLGGFANDGREYVITLDGGDNTPAPWSNVIANPEFGFLVTESGSGFTWALNSHENQLTPWSNDAVSDPPGEVIYLRDEETGEIWTPTALPIRERDGRYIARHGQGYTRFEYASRGIAADLLQFVPLDEPVKISRIALTNRSDRARRLSVTAYVEWALGPARSGPEGSIVTELDASTRAIFARNPRNRDHAGRIAFADLGNGHTGHTGDRTEFLGRNGSYSRPRGLLSDEPLSGRVGAALDPCAVLQVAFDLEPGETVERVFLLGEAATREDARTIIARHRAADVHRSLRVVTARWDRLLERMQVSTPDRALDLMLNRWTLYQTLSCRMFARAAFYQVSGAFGFRDQLQDAVAFAPVEPAITRTHLLLAASRQFTEGDVQHWWHPPAGRGVRTRVSDDLLWLAYAVHAYCEVTADAAVLDERVPFLEGASLAAGQVESYFEPKISATSATIFEHCARALDRSLNVGAHGLPLMGSGDWNDAMDRVGAGGKGESVWLAWFLIALLGHWAPRARARGEDKRADAWSAHAASLREAVDREAWDGDWYRRAFFDDGTPLGSHVNDECRIDAIAQAWSAIAAGPNVGRSRHAMDSLDAHLVRRESRLVLLLTPPFDHTALEPGYIKGYVPGVRENGGQYTHAALWSAIAFAMLSDGDRAGELLGMLTPVWHGATSREIARYALEPYAIAGDVYSEPPHVGRGGWSWYTGSAGWFHRAGTEWLLGLRVRGDHLILDPCIPRTWPGFTASYRFGAAVYEITVENPRALSRGIVTLMVDGASVEPARGVPLADDGRKHIVLAIIGHAPVNH